MSQGAHDIFVLVIKKLKAKTNNQNMSILVCLKQRNYYSSFGNKFDRIAK
jgi:hypothetical protein